ncbi:unnamed protein product [Lathyrus oleraceus]|uniref:LOB domain-containing protein n=1 Tax=Pisum sativum TaxID=3888 RepID=A0A9D5AJD2_PEA|nr:protein ASYMMETRIC LEAVES 2-like [Pisum sativum]KAI5409554.1 hypothetical protein KIW84_055105 [Pisum sativum]
MASSNSPCAACKFLRRKCTQECDFAPYFLPENPQRFANVHRVFGASNVAKLLKELNVADREDAVRSLAYEAESRLKDPIYGCVGLISALQQRLREVQTELAVAKKELSSYNSNPQAMQFLFGNPGAGLQQHQQWNNSQFAGVANANYSYNFPHEMLGGAGMVTRDVQQEQELLEAQQIVASQQDYLLRFSGLHVGGSGGGTAVVSGHADMAHSLGIGSFENGGSGGGSSSGCGYYQIQQQQQGEPQQQHQDYNPHVGVAAAVNQTETPGLLSPQNQENGGEDGRSAGSTHRSS